MSAEEEILQFLRTETRNDLKNSALNYILGLTGNDEGLDYLLQHPNFLTAVASLMKDSASGTSRKSFDCILNASTRGTLSSLLLKSETQDLVDTCLTTIQDSNSESSDKASAILANLTHEEDNAHIVWNKLMSLEKTDDLLKIFCAVDYNKNASYDHLSSVFANITQVIGARRWFMEKPERFQKLLPFLRFSKSETRRYGAASAVRNCCFEIDYHLWLLGQEADILIHLLYPLIGPEELDEDEMEKLPLDLQYLGSEKEREPCADIRKMLIEALTKLCATKEGRKIVKDNGTYYIMRELHKVEKITPVVVACENLVDILIGDEPEPGMENLHEVDIPQDLVEKFSKMDEELFKEDT